MEKHYKLLLNINKLINYIKKTKEYKRYNELANIMKKDKEIISTMNDIKKIERRITIDSSANRSTLILEKDLEKQYEKLKEYPIYLEYSYLQEDLNNLFQNIKNIIEREINKD